METTTTLTKLGRVAYITQANAVAIICRIPKQSLKSLSVALYRRPIYLFSRAERMRMQAIKQFFMDSEGFIDACHQKAEPGRQRPNLVFPNSDPAYHLSMECPCLHSDYRNIEIPPQILMRGQLACAQFRVWFMQNKELYETRTDLFMVKLSRQFDIRLPELKVIEHLNSGVTKMLNENLDAIDRQIHQLLVDAGAFYNATQINRTILRQYQHFAHLGYKDEVLSDNRTGYPDETVKALLRGYNERFKKPLKMLLTSYFRVQYNPELRFTGYLMDQLGIKPCKHCVHNQQWLEASFICRQKNI